MDNVAFLRRRAELMRMDAQNTSDQARTYAQMAEDAAERAKDLRLAADRLDYISAEIRHDLP